MLKQRAFRRRAIYLAVRPLGDEQIGIHRNCDALQFAGLFQSVQELSK
jgi:hypothetical protein